MVSRATDRGGAVMVRVSIRAKPRAKKSRIVSVSGLSVEIALAAPPVDGAANEELIAVLAKALSLPKRAIVLAVGAGSKIKLVDIDGLPAADVIARLEAAVS